MPSNSKIRTGTTSDHSKLSSKSKNRISSMRSNSKIRIGTTSDHSKLNSKSKNRISSMRSNNKIRIGTTSDHSKLSSKSKNRISSMRSNSKIRTGTTSDHSKLNSNSTPSTPLSSNGLSRAPGSSIARETGSRTTAHGNSVVAITATASPMTGSVDLSGRIMVSEFMASHFRLWADIPASSTVAIGSALLIRGQNYWANDWYDTDDVYVTYVDNGYYLYNTRYPSVGIAISISM